MMKRQKAIVFTFKDATKAEMKNWMLRLNRSGYEVYTPKHRIVHVFTDDSNLIGTISEVLLHWEDSYDTTTAYPELIKIVRYDPDEYETSGGIEDDE